MRCYRRRAVVAARLVELLNELGFETQTFDVAPGRPNVLYIEGTPQHARVPRMLLMGAVLHEKMPWTLYAIHAGDALVKTLLMTAILGVWRR